MTEPTPAPAAQPPAEAPGMVLVFCPNCGASFPQPRVKAMAHCTRCGNLWAWHELHILRGGLQGGMCDDLPGGKL